MNEPTQEVCSVLKNRLQEAESHTKAALAKTDADHPLAEPTKELLAIHKEIRDMLLANFEEDSLNEPAEKNDPEVAAAAIEIQRETHTMKKDFKDVLKALFMWVDDPVERTNKSQTEN